MDYIKHIDCIIDTIQNIDFTKKTILTGSNGSGKSIIRKNLGSTLEDILDRKPKIKSVSMELRASVKDTFNIFSALIKDDSKVPSSINTIKFLQGLIEEQDDADYIIFDEAELNCSLELQLGIADYINIKVNKPFLLITHSNLMVKSVHSDNFINLDGLTKDEYLNREIVPISIEELINKSELFRINIGEYSSTTF